MSILQSKLFRTGAKYSVVSTIKSVVAMVAGMVSMLWLDPSEVGKWNTVSIFLAYAPFLQLGIQSGLSIELPVTLGRNEEVKARQFIANGFGFAILVSMVILLIGLLMTYYFYHRLGLDIAMGVVAITIVAICSSFTLHFIARFRSARAFDMLTKVIAIEIPFNVFAMWFIYQFHYYGIIIYNIIIAIVPAVLMYYYMPYKNIKPTIQWNDIFSLGKIGIALMFQSQLQKAAQTLPRWVILAKSSITTLGLFTPAMAVNQLIGLVPGQIGQFFHPQMGYIYGKTGCAKSMWPYVWKMNLILPLMTSPLALVLWFMAPWLLENFFPKYIESMWAMRIMAIAFVFSSSITTSWVLNTLHAFKYAYVFSLTNFVGCFVFPYLMTYLWPEHILTAVTIGLAINNFVCYLVNFILLRIVLFKPQYNSPKTN